MLLQTVTPLGAVLRGVVAGFAGSAAQDAFFALTRPITPESPKDAFEPPDVQQLSETKTETVARRLVTGLAARDALPPDAKRAAGRAVHYGFGGGWGAVYGLVRESVPGLDCARCGAGFGAAVWMVSENALLPAFRLAGGPRRYPLKTHAYAVAAHVVYGVAVYAAYEALRPGLGRPSFGLGRTSLGLGALGLLGALPGKPGRLARRARRAVAVKQALAAR